MITIRTSQERGHRDHGWRDSFYSFSFADYNDPKHMGFRALRVLNEDTIAPGRGFGAHAHRDMEILTYILDGCLAHKDSMGEKHTFGANIIQVMSAGTGVVHSEFNGSETEPVHLLQIWIEPSSEDVEPSYHQIPFDASEKRGRLRLLAGPRANGNGGAAAKHDAATINQNAMLYASELAPGETLDYALGPQRYAWVQVARGSLSVNGQTLAAGDGAAVCEERELSFAAAGAGNSEFLLFDLA